MPLPSLCKNPELPVIFTLPTAPKLAVPLTVSPDSVPKLVIFGCAFVVTVPAVLALVAAPDSAPVNVVALTLPAVILPITFAPVDVKVATFATPSTLIVTLPFVLVISTLLFPLAIAPTVISPAFKFPVTDKLVIVALPDTLKFDSVPRPVTLGCDAVVSVPDIKVKIPLVAPTLPMLALPPTLIEPAVNKLPPVTLPVADTKPPVVRLPPITLPVEDIKPVVVTLAPSILPLADTIPPVIKLAPVMLPVAVINPVPILLMLALPETLRLANVPVLVIFGCAVVVNVPTIDVNTPLFAPILPTLASPVTLNAPPVTKILAEFVTSHASQGWSPEVDHEAHRTFLNWLGCAVGAANHESVDSSLAAIREFQPAPQAIYFLVGEIPVPQLSPNHQPL